MSDYEGVLDLDIRKGVGHGPAWCSRVDAETTEGFRRGGTRIKYVAEEKSEVLHISRRS